MALNNYQTESKQHKEFKNRLDILRNKKEREKLKIKLNETYLEKLGLSKLLEKENLSEKDISDLAQAAGNSGQTVNGWYNKGYYPSMDTLSNLAKAFNVSMEWIMSTNDTITPQFEREYTVFEKYGISEQAYRSLVSMKEQGVDMGELMAGLNHILSFITARFMPADGESAECLPVLEALSGFFNLYENGLRVRYSSEKMQAWMSKLSEGKDELTAEEYKFVLSKSCMPENPFMTDTQSLLTLETYLKQCKGKVVKETLVEIPDFVPIEDGLMSTNGKNSQKAALKELNRIYNNIGEDAEESKNKKK